MITVEIIESIQADTVEEVWNYFHNQYLDADQLYQQFLKHPELYNEQAKKTIDGGFNLIHPDCLNKLNSIYNSDDKIGEYFYPKRTKILSKDQTKPSGYDNHDEITVKITTVHIKFPVVVNK